MEDRKVPWWRKALSFALDGIRAGFGLFSKSAKENFVDEPEITSAQQETPEETELTRQSPIVERIAEAANEAESVSLVTAAQEVEPQTKIDVGPEAALEEVVVAETITVDETPSEETAEEPAEESPESPEAPLEPAPEAETEPEREISTEPEVVPEPAELPAIAAAAEIDVEPAQEPEAPAETFTEHETPAELSVDEEIVPEPVADPVEPEEHIAEAEPAPEMEPAAEQVIIEESVPVEDSVSELADSSVELSEPVTEEVTAQTPGRTDTVEEESHEEVTPAPEAVVQTEHVAECVTEQAAEPVAEEAPEPVIDPMELNEPIPEQAVEPAEANEAVPNEEAPETIAEPTISAEQPDVEQPESELTEVAAATAEAVPAAVTSVASAAEASAEDEPGSAPEPVPPSPPQKPFIKVESRDNEADLSPFSVIVSQVYDGPLDLLLDLIRKQDIDIYDIPIARITAQFLAYVNQLKATDVDVAGEFIYTASLLIHIKSKMLLPRAPSGQDDAAEDPRRELVERLLEHERFKNAAQMLQQKQMLEAASWTNPGMREFQDDTSAEPEIAADTVDLVRIFRDILERARNRPVIDVEEDSVTVGQMIQFLSRRLTMEDKPVALRRLLSHTRSERALIAMFLALLELVRLQAILLRQDLAFSEIFIKKHTGFEAVMNEGAASARDDWR
jgi:segregation and condensation protein A